MQTLDVSAYKQNTGASDDDVRDAIEAAGAWFHTFAFSNGLNTPGRDPSTKKLHGLFLPERLDGFTVLDVGAYEGFFSFHAEARGAARVVAADDFIWRAPGSNALENFRLVRRLANSSVEEVHVSVEDLSAETTGAFDVVLFLGVLYHAPDMIQYLRRVRSVTKRFAVIETLVDLLDVDEPCAAFYPAGSLNNDDTNWWGPNIACVEEMLKRVGFSQFQFIGMWDVNTREAVSGLHARKRVRSGRAVWHAYA